MFLPSDIIMETVTYGGAVNASCHGAGKTQVIRLAVLAATRCMLRWAQKCCCSGYVIDKRDCVDWGCCIYVGVGVDTVRPPGHGVLHT